jgi:glutamyl-Q tRNA(Asp) synthetase
LGHVYPCFCTRKDILREIGAAGNAPHGPSGPIYPGTCRSIPREESKERIASGENHALRLNIIQAAQEAGPIRWKDIDAGTFEAKPERFGDIILARKDAPAAYHLAVVIDDAASGVTLVTRGDDLLAATDIQVLLQRLLNLPQPLYHHHRLLLGSNGKRLAKRDQSATIQSLREAGYSPDEVLNKCQI